MSRQIICRIFFEPEHLTFEQTGPGQIKTHLCRPRRMSYHKAKCAKDTTKFKFIMNQ